MGGILGTVGLWRWGSIYTMGIVGWKEEKKTKGKKVKEQTKTGEAKSAEDNAYLLIE